MNKKIHSVRPNLESLINQIMNQTSLFYMAFYFVFEIADFDTFRALKALILIRGFAAVAFSIFSDCAAVAVFNPYFLQNIISPLNNLLC